MTTGYSGDVKGIRERKVGEESVAVKYSKCKYKQLNLIYSFLYGVHSTTTTYFCV